MRHLGALTILAAMLAIAPAATAAHGHDDPVTNGDFEIGLGPKAVVTVVEGTPADTCVGIGHQVFWGTDSPQQELLGDASHPAVRPDGPQQLVEAYLDGDRDVREDAEDQSGVGHCVSSKSEGADSVWVTPKERLETPLFWSTALEPDRSADFGFSFDSDPFDREVRIPADASKSGHNIWQTFPSKQEAYTANFTTYQFTVEDGQIPSKAKIEVSLSLSPGYAQHPFVGVFYEAQVVFDAEDMVPNANGVVQPDPLQDGRIECPDYQPCRDFRSDYQDADEDGKRALLGQTRLTQNSFWSFNRGDTDVVLDDISIVGATTAAEELAAANVNPNPSIT